MGTKANDEEKRGKLREELADAIMEHAAAPAPAGKPPGKPPKKTSRKKTSDPEPEVSQTAIGNGNIQIGGDWNGELKINTKEVHQHKFTPGPEHITRTQAYKLRELVHKAADIEAVSGLPEGQGRQKWWGKLRRKFKASPYQAIPAELGEAAISWLSQEVAKL